MTTITIGDEEIVLEASFYTLVVYEQEFKSDLIKDVYGRVDLAKARSNYDPYGNLQFIDYTADNWTAYARAAWAMAFTHASINNERFPHFDEWIKKLGATNMNEVSKAVFAEADAGFFRSGAATSDIN